MSRIFAYVVNQHPFYQRMTAVSISMFRDYNKLDKIRVYLIEDGSCQTVQRANMVPIKFAELDFVNLCEHYDVELVRQKPQSFPGEEEYFFANRHVLKDCTEDTVFYLDADTFFFGDPAAIADKYDKVDFAACENEWVWSHGFQKDMLPLKPFNSGVMVWNNGWCQKWAEQLPNLCEEIRTTNTPLTEWIWKKDGKCMGREEFSVSLFVSRNHLSHSYLQKNECWLITCQEDAKRVGRSTIFHSYTNHWKLVYNEVFGSIKSRKHKNQLAKNGEQNDSQ